MNEHQSPWDRHCNESDLLGFQYAEKSLNSPTRQWFCDEVRSWPAGQRLLDAGCGAGASLYALQQAGLISRLGACVGIDGSKKQIEIAKRMVPKKATHFYTADLRTLLPITFMEDQPGFFNRILLRAVLEHTDDPESILRGFSYLMSDDCLLYIVWWNNPVYGPRLRSETCWGVPDIAHDAREIKQILADIRLVVKKQIVILEKSARSDERMIWIVGSKDPNTTGE